jgi:hypothetical protein
MDTKWNHPDFPSTHLQTWAKFIKRSNKKMLESLMASNHNGSLNRWKKLKFSSVVERKNDNFLNNFQLERKKINGILQKTVIKST